MLRGHTAAISIAALRRLFPQRVISGFGDVPWPPRSPDLTAPDFFLWGYLKKVYSGIRVAVVLQPATRIPLQPSHTETPTHIEPRTIRPMW